MNSSSLSLSCLATRIFFFLSGLGLASWAPMIPFVKEKLDLNEAELGIVLLSFGIGALISMPLTGWLIHKVGSRFVSTVAAIFLGLILPILTIAHTSFFLSSTLFLFGAILGILNVGMNAQAILVERKAEKPLMSGFHCLFSLGGLSGTLLVSFLLECGFSLFMIASSVSTILFLGAATYCRFLLPANDDQINKDSSPFSWPSPKTLLLGLFCFICFTAEGAMLDWSAVFLCLSRNYDPALGGLGYAAFSVAMTFGRFIGDKLIQRFGALFMLQTQSLLAAIGMMIAVNMDWGYMELCGFFLVGLGASNIVPIIFSTTGKISNHSPGIALTFVITFGYMGILFGPALIGFVAQISSLSFALTGVAFLLANVCLGGRLLQSRSQEATEVT